MKFLRASTIKGYTKLWLVLFLCISGLIVISACGPKGPYKAMSIETVYGKEIISADCSVWSDGCTLYCRTNTTKLFMDYGVKDKCNAGDIARFRCRDNSYKKTLPKGWSYKYKKKANDCI